MIIGKEGKLKLDNLRNADKVSEKKYMFVGKDYPDVELKMFRKDSILLQENADWTDPFAPRVTGEFFRQFSTKDQQVRWLKNRSLATNTCLQASQDIRFLESRDQPASIKKITTIEETGIQSQEPDHKSGSQSLFHNIANEINDTDQRLIYLAGMVSYRESLCSELHRQTISQSRQMNSQAREGVINTVLGQIVEPKGTESFRLSCSIDNTAEEKVERKTWKAPPSKTELSGIGWEPYKIAYWMLENNMLSFPEGYIPNLNDKVYFAKIAALQSAEISLDPTVRSEEFLASINARLTPSQPITAEHGLNWIYKAALRYLLLKYTDCQPKSKTISEDWISVLQQRFFPGKVDMCQLLKCGSYPIKKKLYYLFKTSVTFKSEFMEYVNTWAVKDHYGYTIKKYRDIYELVLSAAEKKHSLLNVTIAQGNRDRPRMTSTQTADMVKLMNDLANRSIDL